MKPFWMFWHPGSGLPGGLICGAIAMLILWLLGVI